MSPMLAQLGLEPNIDIITKAEIINIVHQKDSYLVRVKQRPRYVDPVKCVSCGICEKKCPVYETKVSPFYDKKRRAIYLPAANGIPRGYVVNEKVCLFFKNGSCRICESVCPKGAINLEQNPKEIELDVQGIIVAPGASSFNPHLLARYGYGKLEDVVTNIEFETFMNPQGATKGKILRPSNGKVPMRIAWIQCLGSRQIDLVNRSYCSSICCSVAIKQALTAKTLIDPPPDTDIYYIDIRTHQKGSERYYRRAKEIGVNFIGLRPFGVTINKDKKLVIDSYSPSKGKIRRVYDMVVLSTGLVLNDEIRQLALTLGIETDKFGFNLSRQFEIEATTRQRIFACGTFNGPKSISGSVVEASAASALLRHSFGHNYPAMSTSEADSIKDSKDIDLFPPKIGLFICCCGTNISTILDTKKLVEFFIPKKQLVHYVTSLSFSCAPDGVDFITKKIKEKGLNRVVIAACSPRSHEVIFKQALKKAGLHHSMLVVANIREQCAWVHSDDKKGAFIRAKEQIIMSINKAKMLEPYEIKEYPVVKKALVLGGGISGMTCAATLAESGIRVFLIEKSKELGGNALSLMKTWRGIDVRNIVEKLKKRLRHNPLVTIYLDSEMVDLHGTTGNFTSYIRTGDGSITAIDHGAFILATGAKEAKPKGYLYGVHPRVLTHQDLDKLLMDSGNDLFKDVKSIVFIQCVGSCDSQRPYCSRVCCTHSVTRAVYLKEHFPHLDIHILYKQLRTYGKKDEYLLKARKMGIKLLRFRDEAPPSLFPVTMLDENSRPFDGLRLEFFNDAFNQTVVLRPDYVILASAIEPDLKNNQRLSAMLKLPLGPDGFFQEMHQKLKPCELKRDGFFVAGLAHYPKEVEESISQASAASAKVLGFLSKEKVKRQRPTAKIMVQKCDGCGLCLEVCREKALSLCEFIFADEKKQMVEIDDSLCNGCGACVGICPKDAIGIPGYMPCEISSQIASLLDLINEKDKV